jgi:hypothetical protein
MISNFGSHHHQLADDRQRDYLTRADRARQARLARRPRAGTESTATARASGQTGARVPLRLVPTLDPRLDPKPSAA